MRLEYTNSFGDRRTSPVHAEFTDADGNRFFVINRARGNYDWEPPYGVIQYLPDEHVIHLD